MLRALILGLLVACTSRVISPPTLQISAECVDHDDCRDSAPLCVRGRCVTLDCTADGSCLTGDGLSPTELSASTDQADRVTLTWAAPAGGQATGYALTRDGTALATLDGDVTTYDDFSATAGAIDAPVALSATMGTDPNGVVLSWTTSSRSGPAHAYTIIALYEEEQTAPSAPALGERGPPPILGYELSRDGGATWVAGPVPARETQTSLTSFMDVAAPLGVLSGPATATFDFARDLVRLDATGVVQELPPAVPYRVRAVTAIGPGPASTSVLGARAAGSTGTIIWERLEGGAWVALNGVTGSYWFDPAPPVQQATATYRPLLVSGAATSAGSASTVAMPGGTLLDIATGEAHTCALRADGRALCWGLNSNGQAPAGPSASIYRELAGARFGTCGVSNTGVLSCWGSSSTGLTSTPTGTGHHDVTAGTSLACALRSNNTPICWGNGSTTPPTVPPTGHTATPAVALSKLSAGSEHACGINTSGGLHCWGNNGGTDNRTVVPGGTFTAVSTGIINTCAVASGTGAVVCWGRHMNAGEAGVPPAIAAIDIAVGSGFACALKTDNTPQCWSWFSGLEAVLTPPSGARFDRIYAGNKHACGRTLAGGIACWGINTDAQAPPRPRTDTFTEISAGTTHTCGLSSSGEVRCWGNPSGVGTPPAGSYAQLYAGDYGSCVLDAQGTPTCWGRTAAPPTAMSRIGPGSTHSCGRISANSLLTCWGSNTHTDCYYDSDLDEEICDTITSGQATPPTVAMLDVDSGTEYSCGIRSSDRGIECWGYPTSVVTTEPAGTYQRLSAGTSHACAIALDNTVTCWGNNTGNRATAPGGAFASISAGGSHSCGLSSAGAATCWGSVPISVPSSMRFSRITAGGSHTCGIMADSGHVVCWGSNTYGQAPPL